MHFFKYLAFMIFSFFSLFNKSIASSENLENSDFNQFLPYQFFLLEGYLGEPINQVVLGRIPQTSSYFADQLSWFRENGISASILNLNTQATSDQNSGTIYSAIASSKKPVVFLAHSKGGVDALVALVKYPSLQSKVKAIVTIQSPFFGSPIADKIYENPLSFVSAAFWLKFLNGGIASLDDLRVGNRTSWMENHDADIAQLANQTQLVSFSSRKSNRFGIDTPFEIFRNAMLLDGVENDGLVPTSSGRLPYSDYVFLDDVDHIMPVIEFPGNFFDRRQFTETLLSHISL